MTQETVAGQYLGVAEEGNPLVGILLRGAGRSVVKWFAPGSEDLVSLWVERFSVGDAVECSLVLDQDKQRMLITEMRCAGKS